MSDQSVIINTYVSLTINKIHISQEEKRKSFPKFWMLYFDYLFLFSFNLFFLIWELHGTKPIEHLDLE